jgi:cystathionine beta-lyase/cystathionine gamma-synthase
MIREIKHVRAATGAMLHPMASYLLHRGLPTLELRVLRMQATAQIIAERLAEDPRVAAIHYPGLPGQDPKGLLETQMHGAGSVMSFELASEEPAVMQAFISALTLITPAVSLGSTDTLIQPPAALTHRVLDPETRARTGITPGLVRLSVGLEDASDLWRDLQQGLGVVPARRDVQLESSHLAALSR